MSKFRNILIDSNLFPSFILSTDLRSLVSNDSINEDFSAIRRLDDGEQRTNFGGWHSKLFNKSDEFGKYPSLKNLYTLTIEFVGEFLDGNHTDLYVSDVQGWLLENESEAYNTPHNHGKTDLIAVYYVNVPDSCGGITLLRTDAFTHTALCGSNDSREFANSFTPSIDIGRLYVMPGHLYHYVKSFPSDGLRRSVVFNINCRDRQFK